jgi:ABC-2 type transport system permease protein
MIDSLRAELLVLRKRTATWVLLAVSMIMSVIFTYAFPYASYLETTPSQRTQSDLLPLLPQSMVSSVLGGFPFYFGMFALILGVLHFGSEYGWGTFKTTFMQRSDRITVFVAKLGALVLTLSVFTVSVFVTGAVASLIIAGREGAAISWPSAFDFVRALGAGWLLLSLWAFLGVLLASLSRGIALAMGLGIVYGLVVEGLVTGFGSSIQLLHDVSEAFLRTNGYSLIAPLQITTNTGNDGPGFFSGPFVNEWHALIVIAGYLVLFAAASGLLLARRDVA